MAVGAAVASSNNNANASNAYNAGYSAGATNTNTAAAANANAAAANANAAAANANMAAAYSMGSVHGALPAGSASMTVNGQPYYLSGNTWFSPSYGANGVYYRVVPTP